MAISVRVYIFEQDGALKRVPRRVFKGLTLGPDTIPEYAGTRQRVAEVIVENEHGKPVRILHAQGVYWTFDGGGRIDEEAEMQALRASMEIAVRSPRTTASKVIDLRPDLKRKKWREEYCWDLRAEDLNRITADLWPGPL